MKLSLYNRRLNRNLVILLIVDSGSILLGFFMAAMLRHDFTIPEFLYTQGIFAIVASILFLKIAVFRFFKLYRGMWRYTSVWDMVNILKANLIASILIITAIGFFRGFDGIARSIFILDFLLTAGFTGASRLGVRLFFTHLLDPKTYKKDDTKRVILLGAGATGEFICRELLSDKKHLMQPIGFMDDNEGLHGAEIHGIPVIDSIDMLSKIVLQYDEALICCPTATREEMRRIIKFCKASGKTFRTLPSVSELVQGQVSVSQFREVSLVDLLGRDEVVLDKTSILKYIKGKRIIITGAGGSIGSELVRQCLKFKPALLVMLDNSEFNLFKIEREILTIDTHVLIKPVLSDIRDSYILDRVFQEFEPQVVLHAAAYKHVPMQEAFPWEAVKTNVLGTSNMVNVSIEHDVEKFVLVSTDKAVKPVNVMGATKRLAELIIQGANRANGTDFMAVRFGNVLGSSGSVIPIFQEQIKSGGPVTITDPDMERYFMSIPEAAQLILQTGGLGEGGEVFVLDMGEPIRILDIAHELIRLSGYEPELDIPISFIGARPGEKKVEELVLDSEYVDKTSHEKIMIVNNDLSTEDITRVTDRILAGELDGKEFDKNEIRRRLSSLVMEYEPDKDQREPVILRVQPEVLA